MIKVEHTEVYGWEHSILGMRNPMNSWERSDSYWTHIENPETLNTANFQFFMGENDFALARRLVNSGNEHRKFMRMITVYCDITAPLYWWKEFDTYKIGTVANSCSTMHKITSKEFTIDDFSVEHLDYESINKMQSIITWLNYNRQMYVTGCDGIGKTVEPKQKQYWLNIIQMLPSSYNQKRTVMLNYEVLRNIYHTRKHHKLDEWIGLCKWIETLPYAELITE